MTKGNRNGAAGVSSSSASVAHASEAEDWSFGVPSNYLINGGFSQLK
jgi:hypothetical protein